jgi:2'-5' RNA ligase
VENPKILSEIASATSTLQSIGGDLKIVDRENIHLTLKFLGYISQSKIPAIKSSLETVKFNPFEMTLQGFGGFPTLNRMNVIWVGITTGWNEVEHIYEQTEKIFQSLGFPRETRPFSPHITVARVRSSRNRQEMAQFLKTLQDNVLGHFQVSVVRLKQSILSSLGPKYSTLYESHA